MRGYKLEEKIKELDRSGMGDLIYNLPSQIEETLKIMEEVKFPSPFQGVRNIIINGLGGSAIGGDLLRGYLREELSLPLLVNRSYTLPQWVGEETLSICVSYSGNTEETLSSFQASWEKGAQIMGITSGGKLGKECQDKGCPWIKIPSGLPPRAALGYLFFALVLSLEKLQLIKRKREEILQTKELLEELREELKPQVYPNLAIDIASKIHNTIPLIYSTSDFLEGVAMRWKTQINENAKHPCYFCVFPELDHNEIMGWEGVERKDFTVVVLMDRYEPERMVKRIENTLKIMGGKPAFLIEVNARGESLLERIFSLVYIGDYVSYYLGILNGVDPTEIKSISLLKKMMRDEGSSP